MSPAVVVPVALVVVLSVTAMVFGGPVLIIPILLGVGGVVQTRRVLKRVGQAREMQRFRERARTTGTEFDARDRETQAA